MKRHHQESPADSQEKMKRQATSIRSIWSRMRIPSRIPSAVSHAYTKPTEIGCFSFDGERKLYLDDRSELLPYNRPKVPYPLGEGFPDKYIERDKSKEDTIDHLLKFIQHKNKERLELDQDPIVPHFLTWRGIMRRIMGTPFLRKDEWKLRVIKYKKTIYISEVPLDEIPKHEPYPDEDLLTYYGYKFESLCTSPPSSTSESSKDIPIVNTNIQFCSVFRSQLLSSDLVLGGEVDCYDPELVKDGEIPTQASYMELKTQKVFRHQKAEQSFARFKAQKIWGQSFLAGVPQITIGFRDEKGNLVSTEQYKTSDMMRMGRIAGWDPLGCLAFLDKVLQYLRTELAHVDDRKQVYTLEYKPTTDFVELRGPVNRDGYGFLPEWFEPY